MAWKEKQLARIKKEKCMWFPRVILVQQSQHQALYSAVFIKLFIQTALNNGNLMNAVSWSLCLIILNSRWNMPKCDTNESKVVSDFSYS